MRRNVRIDYFPYRENGAGKRKIVWDIFGHAVLFITRHSPQTSHSRYQIFNSDDTGGLLAIHWHSCPHYIALQKVTLFHFSLHYGNITPKWRNLVPCLFTKIFYTEPSVTISTTWCALLALSDCTFRRLPAFLHNPHMKPPPVVQPAQLQGIFQSMSRFRPRRMWDLIPFSHWINTVVI
jgi:hypothetical protein